MQNCKIITNNNPIYDINHYKYDTNYFLTSIDANELIQRFRNVDKFISYCKKCDKYNNSWACPPFDINDNSNENYDNSNENSNNKQYSKQYYPDEYFLKYETAQIIGTKIILDKELFNNNQTNNYTQITNDIIKKVRLELDNMLLNMESKHSKCKVFFAGTCYLCPAGECARIKKNVCINPEKVRPSLEAHGFDVCNIAKELFNIEIKWSNDNVLPEYLTLISGFLH